MAAPSLDSLFLFVVSLFPLPPQMTTILQHFQKVRLRQEARYRAQQLVAVARRWSAHMSSLLANHMPCACIVASVLKEVALYAGVQQVYRPT